MKTILKKNFVVAPRQPDSAGGDDTSSSFLHLFQKIEFTTSPEKLAILWRPFPYGNSRTGKVDSDRLSQQDAQLFGCFIHDVEVHPSVDSELHVHDGPPSTNTLIRKKDLRNLTS